MGFTVITGALILVSSTHLQMCVLTGFLYNAINNNVHEIILPLCKGVIYLLKNFI